MLSKLERDWGGLKGRFTEALSNERGRGETESHGLIRHQVLGDFQRGIPSRGLVQSRIDREFRMD